MDMVRPILLAMCRDLELIARLVSLHSCREQGDPSKVRDFLPPGKQYLMTRNVPCLRRAANLAYTDADEVSHVPRSCCTPSKDAAAALARVSSS